MIELLLLKYLLTKTTYQKYYKYIHLSSKDLQKIYYIIKIVMEESDADATVSTLELTFFTEYPFLRPTEKESFEVIFRRLETLELDESRLIEYLDKQRNMSCAREVAEIALEVSEGRKEFSELLDHVDGLDLEKPHEEEIKFVSSKLTELYTTQIATPGLRWRLNSLNYSLGSLRRGDFGFLFARPETGKTTFLASEATFMAEQSTGPILWFNNEEQGEKVGIRCIQASVGQTQAAMAQHLQHYEDMYLASTHDNIKIVDEAAIHKNEVERICKALSPSLIIFDQIDKIKGFDADRNDLLLGNIYIWARELAKKYAPVIGVCQADGTGEGVKYLNMGHVANAKTAKQAEADWILGIGKSNENGLEYMRHFNITKNKLQGDSDTKPEMRHGQFDCIIRPETARYQDLG